MKSQSTVFLSPVLKISLPKKYLPYIHGVATNSLSQGSFHPYDQIPLRYVTPGFKPSSKNT